MISGCDSGFGQQLALRLNAMGVLVYAGVLDDNSEGAKMLKALNCPKMKVVPFDVTSDTDVCRAATFVNTDLGERSECKLRFFGNAAKLTLATKNCRRL
jgi:3-hydroxybutyrate dehydrogenase